MSNQLINSEVLKTINDAWLNIAVEDRYVINPLEILRTDDPDEFHMKFTWLLMQPEYFSFVCRNILNIDLLPMQALMLKEMWNRKFPMLIGSRGLGKTFLLSLYCMLRALFLPGRKIVVVGAAFRQSKFLHDYMENIWKNSPILRDLCDGNSGPRRDVDMCRMTLNGSVISALPIGDGCCRGDTLITGDSSFSQLDNPVNIVWGNGNFREVDYPIDNGVKPTKIITTNCGYSYEGTYNHAMKILRDGKIDWVRTDEIQIGDRILIDRSQRWHNGDFPCTEDEAYALGAMIGDGCWTNQYKLRFANKDQDIINRINRTLDFSQCKDGIHWDINSKSKVSEWVNYWGLKELCQTKDKTLPKTILSAPKDKMTACIQGLFDTDGHVFVDTLKGGITTSVNFTNTSKRLVEQLQYILLHYGIVSTVKFRDRDEKWERVYELGIYGKNVKLFAEQINFYVSRKRNKLNEAIEQKKNWNSFNDDIPLDNNIVAESIDRTGHVPTKYCHSKIIAKKSFQQSFLQDILPYCNNPEWEELVNPGIFYDTISSIEDSKCHTYDIHVPDGNEYCANGFFSHNSKIRGQRANDIIADEFASMSRDIFENVIAGFASVMSSPADNVKKLASEAKAKELGVDPKLLVSEADEFMDKSNQIILSGTAFYDFNHFADYWKRWKAIINTKGDPHKISTDVFSGEEIPDSFKWDDYSIIRIPVDLVPRGFMDEGQIARSKATVHNGIYLMEFGACLGPDSLITTDSGLKKIVDVEVGDLVLSHKGKFCPVSKKKYRPYRGKIIRQKSYGYNQDTLVTPDHPYWDGQDFIAAKDLKSNHLKNLEFTNGIEDLFPELILDDILETHNGRFYPKGSKSNITLEQQREIRNSNKSQSDLAKDYNLSQSAISYIQNCKNVPKNSIPSVVKLNYNLGCIIGYYAAEGSISKNGNAVEFALDEHKDTSYQKHLQKCIYQEFGFHPKTYTKKKNTVVISINSRLVADIIKRICPGKSDTKLVDHHIMFSNEDFMRGFIVGYWNGDGHINRFKKYAKTHCINQSLLNQVKISLSYFNIAASLTKGSQGNDYHLNIRSNNFVRFMLEFYGEVFDSCRKSKITNDNTDSIFELQDVTYEDYDGIVYNLEVEEDNSYSLPHTTIHNCFAKDSQGFFKRSLIESCVGTDQDPVRLKSGDVYFDPMLKGNLSKRYVMGVDPASEVDNFSITILELNEDHRRIVYCWTTTRKDHVTKVKKGLTDENNFYSYCARKIRNLMDLFPICHIALDAQGGGISVAEALHDSKQLKAGEIPIWPIIEEDKEKPSDDEQGLHILEMCQFAKYEWYSEANHGMRKDFEDKLLIFPRFDPITIGLSIEEDKANNRLYDTLEDCVMEIEELKNELALIEITQTANGRDRWDTPEVKVGVGKKERMRKDRYSSLLMANMAARTIAAEVKQAPYVSYGGFARMEKGKGDGPDYTGPNWFTEGIKGVY